MRVDAAGSAGEPIWPYRHSTWSCGDIIRWREASFWPAALWPRSVLTAGQAFDEAVGRASGLFRERVDPRA